MSLKYLNFVSGILPFYRVLAVYGVLPEALCSGPWLAAPQVRVGEVLHEVLRPGAGLRASVNFDRVRHVPAALEAVDAVGGDHHLAVAAAVAVADAEGLVLQ